MALGSALTVGYFDGVHRGHQALIQRVIAAAARLGCRPGAVTFDLHSLEVLHDRGPLLTLLTTEEKSAALRSCGLEDVHVLHFTREFAAQSGEEFVDRVLVGELGAQFVAVGYDFRFGRERSCGAADMVRLAARHGVAVEVVERVSFEGERVSSRVVREHVAAGEVAEAARLMGRPYQLGGEVVAGCRVGRTIGFPTANVQPPPRKLLPANGVYAALADVAGRTCPAVVNVGVRPTVSGEGITVEAHLLDFDGDCYGQIVTLRFQERLRGEVRFADLTGLQAQIERDVAAARGIPGGGREAAQGPG